MCVDRFLDTYIALSVATVAFCFVKLLYERKSREHVGRKEERRSLKNPARSGRCRLFVHASKKAGSWNAMSLEGGWSEL